MVLGSAFFNTDDRRGSLDMSRLRRRGIHQINHRTSLLIGGGKQRRQKSGVPEIFTILTSPHRKKGNFKVLIPNRNPVVELYRLFPQLQPGEKPVNGFTCALHKDILLQGRIVICTNCICFHSNIFGYETRLIIYFKNVLAIRREKTAFVVPNAISIRTVNKRYLFCSFLSRESVFKLLLRVWKSSMNPEAPSPPKEDVICTEIKPPDYRYEKTDFAPSRLLISSSASYDPPNRYSKNYDFRERPHSSPPSLCNFYASSELDVRKETIQQYMDGTAIPSTGGALGIDLNIDEEESSTGTGDESSDLEDGTNEALKQVALLRSRKLFKSNTLGDLRELESVCNVIGEDKIGIIKRNLVRAHEKHPINIPSSPTTKPPLSSYIETMSSSTMNFVNWLFMKQTSFFFISLLFLLLALLSLSLMVRINNISSSLQKQQLDVKPDYASEENLKMQHLFKFQDDVHNANVQRMKTILSKNIETVNEVQEKLRELREKLKE